MPILNFIKIANHISPTQSQCEKINKSGVNLQINLENIEPNKELMSCEYRFVNN